MAKYMLKQTSKSSWIVTLRRKKVGFGRITKDGVFVCKIKDHRVEASSMSAAFSEAVRINNRIAICGENDEQKAREVIRKENEEVRREAEEFNRHFGGSGFRMVTRSRRANI